MALDFPQSLPVASVDRQSSDYKTSFRYHERLRKLYEGGQTIHFWSSEFLNHRAMEPADVFSDRLKQFTYINHLGNIIGWYIAALFKDPPTVTLRKRGIAGEDAIPAAAAAQEKLASFQNDCDGAGRSFLDFWAQEVEKRKLLYGKAYRSEERRVGKECRSRWSPYH